MEKPTIHVVIGLVTIEDKVICVRQADDKIYPVEVNKPGEKDFLAGLWHLPGGKVNAEELIEDGLRRELVEETCSQIEIVSTLGERIEEREQAVLHLHWFLCKGLTKDIKANDDAAELKLIPKNEVPNACDPKVVAQWPSEVRDYFKI